MAQSATPQRPPYHVTICSKNRVQYYDDPADCSIVFRDPIQSISSFKISSFSIPNTIYNITSETRGDFANNVILLGLKPVAGPDVTCTVTVPPGQYTITSLLTRINQILINAMGVTTYIQLTYDSDTQKVTFTSRGLSSLWMSTVQFAEGSKIAEALGLTSPQTYFNVEPAHSTTVVSPKAAQLSSPKWLFVTILSNEQLLTQQRIGDSTGTLSDRRCHFKIPLTSGNGSIVWNDEDVAEKDKIKYWITAGTLNRLRFMFFDELGNAVNFNGADWVITLECWFGSCC